MELFEIKALKENIDPKIEKGDYIILSKMLGVAQTTARMRYYRDMEDAVLAMQKIVDVREKLIESYNQKQ